ncbi:MAG: hypothetical protein GX630_05125 [Actinobacteria bacterium]|nr:hypothetical protein [Actinomycetota bacterium]
MYQSARDRFLDQATVRELVDAFGESEDEVWGVIRARISRFFADFLMRIGLLSDLPCS